MDVVDLLSDSSASAATVDFPRSVPASPVCILSSGDDDGQVGDSCVALSSDEEGGVDSPPPSKRQRVFPSPSPSDTSFQVDDDLLALMGAIQRKPVAPAASKAPSRSRSKSADAKQAEREAAKATKAAAREAELQRKAVAKQRKAADKQAEKERRAEEKKAEKERKAAQREMEKASRKAAREEAKADADSARHLLRSDTGKFAHQELHMKLDNVLAAESAGKQLLAAAAENDPIIPVLPAEPFPVDSTITFHRRKFITPTTMSTASTQEAVVVVLWKGARFVNLLGDGVLDGAEADVANIRSKLAPATRIMFVVHGAQSYIARRMSSQLPCPVLPQRLEQLTTALYVRIGLEVHHLTTPAKVCQFVCSLHRQIAEAPYKKDASSLDVVRKVKIPRYPGAGDDYAERDGDKRRLTKSPTETWWAFLQMIPGVSAAKASAITKVYPTVASLLEKYRDPGIPFVEKTALVALAMKELGRNERMLSTRVHTLLTSKKCDDLIR